LNRFSRDQDVVDNSIADSLRMLLNLAMSILGILVMMVYIQVYFILALAPILWCYWYFQRQYRRVNREIKRMDSTSRSPLFSHFSETLTGLPTIRAYAQQASFILTNESRMDTNNRFYFLVVGSQRWLGTRLEVLGGLIIFCTAIIASSNATSIQSGLVGLSLSYAMQVTTMMSFFLRQSVESENYMNSVDRSKVSAHTPRRGLTHFTHSTRNALFSSANTRRSLLFVVSFAVMLFSSTPTASNTKPQRPFRRMTTPRLW
jgi:ABC-type multidrug transport system fused ATPase/permease subunit